MNTYQKATVLLSLAILPLVLLFMAAMNSPGVLLTGAAWLASTAALFYALRTVNTGAPRLAGRSGQAVAARLPRRRRLKALGLR